MKVKGFIEVTPEVGNSKNLINVSYIEEVIGNTIYIGFTVPGAYEQDCVDCKENYEEIKKLIEEASA